MAMPGLKQRPLLRFLYHTLWEGLDWVFPPTCGGCGRFGWRWCPDCQRNTLVIDTPVCPICCLEEPSGRICAECQAHPPPFTSLKSWGVYKGALRSAVHRMKYQRDIGLSEEMSRYMEEVFRSSGWNVD